MSIHNGYIIYVVTPDGTRPFEAYSLFPIRRPKAQAEAIAASARDPAAKKGWRLEYRVEAVVLP